MPELEQASKSWPTLETDVCKNMMMPYLFIPRSQWKELVLRHLFEVAEEKSLIY